jgi:hypothetical protein
MPIGLATLGCVAARQAPLPRPLRNGNHIP